MAVGFGKLSHRVIRTGVSGFDKLSHRTISEPEGQTGG